MLLSRETMLEEMEKIVDVTKDLVQARGEAWPTIFVFREGQGLSGRREEMKEEPWLEHSELEAPSSVDLDVMSIPCRPIHGEKDLRYLQDQMNISAFDRTTLAVGVVMNILFADPDTDPELLTSESGALPAIYVAYYTKGSREISHKMIPYRLGDPLSQEEIKELMEEMASKSASGRVPKVMTPKYSVSFVDDLDWDPEEYAPERMVRNPWLSI